MTEKDYLRTHSTPASDALQWLERETHIRTNHARMLSGHEVGSLLSLISELARPMNILELGVFTGYSTICLAKGLAEGGVIHAVEINDELEDLIREAYGRAGITDRVQLHIGDAKKIIPELDCLFDLVYIDANKREYPEYYRLVFDKVVPGGLIVADNVLWDGKVFQEPVPEDGQTRGIAAFNDLVAADPRVENFILPVRDGLSIIRKLS
ncbi:MAG: class I SAM-dependent methyltransferase [Bacteroidales bacterium]|nr:class I SAM-dependent methyltransferase [Bacteroidales bacterium]